ncbi:MULTISPECIES: alpha,alpha-trehalase TreF [Sphingomonas]|jgi:alpha,alpha-trehalase|uniref:alpha,alpha-trehalase TreF n=1 Tax=Sphingomonas TaxID=13687 RepID=UPI000DBC23C8|nr:MULTISPECIES: alpha,alpha-trehalase TreF [Sphingomonas]PZT93151.1 MAG: trehalase [Sphingomonas sp.]WCP73243.1 alpha,alpha-trehalase TreF [Sphingomonas hankookensis]
MTIVRTCRWLIPVLLAGCTTAQAPRPVASVVTTPAAAVPTPADRFGPLFEAVQMRRLFPDGKTFVDSVPKRPDAAILADYRKGSFDDAALKAFVLANFDVPGLEPVPESDHGPRLPIERHIAELWPHLTRDPVTPPPGSTALAVKDRFVVPGGRFRELYYWDSYFTMLGLVADRRQDLVESMLDGFVDLVERYGHVPNGTRTYYLSRSQPPFLYLMMGLSQNRDPAVAARRLAALKREYAYFTTPERSVTLPDGAVLQHYWDARTTPRDESWREDVETAKAAGRPVGDTYRDLRAGAENGWDYSSRWLGDGRTLATIDTTSILPADLNSLLWGMERAIAEGAATSGDTATARDFGDRAAKRGAAIERWLWSEAEGRYGDYDVKRRLLRDGVTAATAYPLFVGLTTGARAARVAGTIERQLLAPGGLRTTRVDTGQQWDKPNGWAPLQWIAVAGLDRTGNRALADRIAQRFLATVQREYAASGKLVEKYDVEEVKPGGGGEYPLQDGFGWTNGVTRALMERGRGS